MDALTWTVFDANLPRSLRCGHEITWRGLCLAEAETQDIARGRSKQGQETSCRAET
ncbi:predicted protein [Histoplasma mississippiense (nom. inval.)]|uniref:predicted protein n=1 Tax=Ajellomyces capsulatus (strain NAm1 / WU24) TaxID=2059318 RepID=UPI000157C3FC|nr:predicted protein [Histoplasma mississippiense (nom. inval.)]EDN07954.1 predicted protein [Histoplasma mississippiense (nom. inval.)]